MKKNITTLWALSVPGLFVAFPLLFPNPAVTSVAVFVLIFAGAAMGYNIFSGYSGYISLGHAAFYGLGAYFLALMCQLWNIPGGIIPFLLLPVVGLLTGVCSLLLGWIALKTKRYTFLVITIAIFGLVAQLPNFLTGIIPGIGELTLPIPPWSGDVYNLPFYYVALLLLLVVSVVSWWIRHSRYGLNLLAIRDDEARAEGLGLKAGPLKLIAFMVSASFAAMAGAMTVYFIGVITPPSAFDRSSADGLFGRLRHSVGTDYWCHHRRGASAILDFAIWCPGLGPYPLWRVVPGHHPGPARRHFAHAVETLDRPQKRIK